MSRPLIEDQASGISKPISEIAERMRAFAIVREFASRELIRKWAREIEEVLKREEA